MKIWHFGDVHWSPTTVNGVNIAVREVTSYQAAAGNDVSIIVEGDANADAAQFARDNGITLISLPPGLLAGRAFIRKHIRKQRPEIVHLHSVFIRQHCIVAAALRSAGIPYVVTPHGGLAWQVLERGRLKKRVYGLLFEKPRFVRARCITVVAPGEIGEVREYVPDFKGLLSWVPNPVECGPSSPTWRFRDGRPQIVFLGRFDVQHKGIDMLVDLARHVPEADFHLYGEEDARTKAQLRQLKADATSNVYFHKPVFTIEKEEVLTNATLYLQPSRWEAFGISVGEAMCLGVPCAITSTMNLAEFFERNDLGLVFPVNVAASAALLRTALSDPAKLVGWAEKGRRFAESRFKPAVVAEAFLQIYRHCLDIEILDPSFTSPDSASTEAAQTP